ncbi:MFS transporter [Corynebacterium falsenii]|uniref:MFS transporter n=1 Tax=Corynebacterium falsenii TaxID=108486 RepID=UPI001CCA037E|nr:MFS transporter [Corynebacterium falsenii]UBI07626.1 MFS transporter [Corynebacterium falsenii]
MHISWKWFTDKFVGTPPDSDLDNVEENSGRYSLGFGAQNIGDQIVSAKTVLPWFLTSVGGPAWVISFLVPVRESGSMLPQAFLRPWLQHFHRRLPFMLVGAAGQAVACVIMLFTALFAHGTVAGLLILASLALLATARALVSLTSKDVAGRVVPKGYRGHLTGFATTLSGTVAIVVGIVLQALRGNLTTTTFAVLFVIAALAWVAAIMFFRGIREQVVEDVGNVPSKEDGWLRQVWVDIRDLLSSDPAFRRFVIVRTLLLTSALSPTFIVAIASHVRADGLAASIFTGLGTFVLASGVASLLAGRVSGWLSDVSSRNTMTGAALLASTILVITVVLTLISDATSNPQTPDRTGAEIALIWWLPVAFFVVSLAHAAIRVARSTYIVDMAEGEQRTRYVSVANTLMGILLLIVGAFTSVLAIGGPQWALAALALFGFTGAALSHTLPEVSLGKQ